MVVNQQPYNLPDGRKIIPVEVGRLADCTGCIGGNAFASTCAPLPACDGIIWVEGEPAAVAPARLTTTEINTLKQQAIDKYGATWLHEFGSFVEAEVYRRLGAPMPEVSDEQA